MKGYGAHPFVNPTKIEKYTSPWLSGLAADTDYPFYASGIFTGTPEIVIVQHKITSTTIGLTAGQIVTSINGVLVDWNGAQDFDAGAFTYYDEDSETFYYRTSDACLYLPDTTGEITNLGFGNYKVRIIATRAVIGDIPDITRVGLVPLEKKIVANGDADVQFNLAQYFNDYEDFEIDFKNVRCATDSAIPSYRTSSDGTAFDSGASDYTYCTLYSLGSTPTISINTGVSSLNLCTYNTGTGANEVCNGKLEILGASDPNYYSRFHRYDHVIDSTGTNRFSYTPQHRNSQEQTEAIQFFASTGNLQEGTLILYGKRKVN